MIVDSKNKKIIYLASDHAGFDLKNQLIHFLTKLQTKLSKTELTLNSFHDFDVNTLGFSQEESALYTHLSAEQKSRLWMILSHFEFCDLGPQGLESVDYPDYASAVCEALKDVPQSFGVLICGSGQGMSLRANKYSHIRAALVYNNEISELSRAHNDANIICLGSRFCTLNEALQWVIIFISTEFSGGRHAARVAKIHKSTT